MQAFKALFALALASLVVALPEPQAVPRQIDLVAKGGICNVNVGILSCDTGLTCVLDSGILGLFGFGVSTPLLLRQCTLTRDAL